MGQFVLPTLRRDNLSPMLNPKFGYFGDFNADKIEEYNVRRKGGRARFSRSSPPVISTADDHAIMLSPFSEPVAELAAVDAAGGSL
jgi:hypothetical protein